MLVMYSHIAWMNVPKLRRCGFAVGDINCPLELVAVIIGELAKDPAKDIVRVDTVLHRLHTHTASTATSTVTLAHAPGA